MYKKYKTKRRGAVSALLSIMMGIGIIFLSVHTLQSVQKTSQISSLVAQANNQTISDAILLAINSQRTQHSLPTLQYNVQLVDAAQRKADNMVNEHYFAHIRPKDNYKWSQFIDAAGYNYTFAGENLARGYQTVEDMIQAWMNSPEHKENILSSNFVETGIGYTVSQESQSPVLYVSQMFGAK